MKPPKNMPPIVLTAEMATALTLAAAAGRPRELSIIAPVARNMLVLHGLLSEVTPRGAKQRVYRITRRGDNVRQKWANTRPADE
jgi:hypothetical protein